MSPSWSAPPRPPSPLRPAYRVVKSAWHLRLTSEDPDRSCCRGVIARSRADDGILLRLYCERLAHLGAPWASIAWRLPRRVNLAATRGKTDSPLSALGAPPSAL